MWLIKDNPEISAKELAHIVDRSSRTMEGETISVVFHGGRGNLMASQNAIPSKQHPGNKLLPN